MEELNTDRGSESIFLYLILVAFVFLLLDHTFSTSSKHKEAHCSICGDAYESKNVMHIAAVGKMRDFLGEPFRMPICKKCLPRIKGLEVNNLIQANISLIRDDERAFVNRIIMFQRFKEGNKELVIVKDELPIIGKN